MFLTFLVVAVLHYTSLSTVSPQLTTSPQNTLNVQGSPVCVQACNEPEVQ